MVLNATSQGTQGTLDTASKQELENEFGSSVDETVIEKILEKGEKIHSKVRTFQPPPSIPGETAASNDWNAKTVKLTQLSIHRCPSAKAPRTTLRVAASPTEQCQLSWDFRAREGIPMIRYPPS